MDEAVELAEEQSTIDLIFDKCMQEAPSRKRSRIRTNVEKEKVPEPFSWLCNHGAGAHDVLVGKEEATGTEGEGVFKTKKGAEYPSEMCRTSRSCTPRAWR